MLGYVMIGAGFAFAAALQPGPLQAYLLSSVVQRGWQRTLPASFAPLLSDVPIVLVSLFLLNHVPITFQTILRVAGGVLLLYYAWLSLRGWQEGIAEESERAASAPRTLFQAAMVNLLNPNPYLGWSLVLGPVVMDAWRQNPLYAVTLIVAFYVTMVVGLAGTIFLFGRTDILGPRGRRAMLLISGAVLAFLGIYQLAFALLPEKLS